MKNEASGETRKRSGILSVYNVMTALNPEQTIGKLGDQAFVSSRLLPNPVHKHRALGQEGRGRGFCGSDMRPMTPSTAKLNRKGSVAVWITILSVATLTVMLLL